MNNTRLNELIGASIATGEPLTAEAVAGVLTDEELSHAFNERSLAMGTAAVKGSSEPVYIKSEQSRSNKGNSKHELFRKPSNPVINIEDRYKHLSNSDLLKNLAAVRSSIDSLEYDMDGDYQLGLAHEQDYHLCQELARRGVSLREPY